MGMRYSSTVNSVKEAGKASEPGSSFDPQVREEMEMLESGKPG